jgi:predicted regulator of Ras-like GTPase activity (Roadblock/LC7/MglB family)
MDQPTTQEPVRLVDQLALLRERVTGVRGAVVAAADGLLLAHEGDIDHDPHDLAALAAAAHGIARQSGLVLNQGDHHQTAIHNADGHYVVYAVSDGALLAVVAATGLNIAQLNIQIRASAADIDKAIHEDPGLLVHRLDPSQQRDEATDH